MIETSTEMDDIEGKIHRIQTSVETTDEDIKKMESMMSVPSDDLLIDINKLEFANRTYWQDYVEVREDVDMNLLRHLEHLNE